MFVLSFFDNLERENIKSATRTSTSEYTGHIQWVPRGKAKKGENKKTTPFLDKNPTNLQNQRKPILMLIEPILSLTGDPLVGIARLLEAILSHGEGRNN